MVTVTDDLADRDPVLAALASASVYGLETPMEKRGVSAAHNAGGA